MDTEGREEAARYEVHVEGLLDERWSAWFDGLQLTSEPGGATVIAGPVADQAALHGLLAKVRDLGLPLLSSAAWTRPDIGVGARDTQPPGSWAG
jgi:hypothetical protein